LVNDLGSHSHDGNVRKEPFEASSVGLFHKTNQDSIIQDAITLLLAFRVLGISPIFIRLIRLAHTIGIRLFLEKL
jgi:hypothetical protein